MMIEFVDETVVAEINVESRGNIMIHDPLNFNFESVSASMSIDITG